MLSGNYNLFDRLLHNLAFSSPLLQKALYDLENDLFRSRFEALQSGPEVFVTGLPRSGTTLILNLLYGTGEFACFTYRQMPFVLSPLIWATVSRLFQRRGRDTYRAHGDGVKISYDSPEAFEEILWLSFLKKKIVRKQTLAVVSPEDCTPEFIEALRTTAKKLTYLKSSHNTDEAPSRYLSKNNANISRVDSILSVFPAATLIIPFRHPLAHVSSLVTQHERFLHIHKEDGFARKYMEWLGHYEFGANFRPIDFGNWLDEEDLSRSPEGGFWLRYWTAAYRSVLATTEKRVYFMNFDDLLRRPGRTLEQLASVTSLRHGGRLNEQAARIRAATSQLLDAGDFRASDCRSALSVYAELCSRAL
jgi:hypothetical protein